MIKFYAWEQNFADAINDVRAQEVVVLTSQAFWRAFIGFFLIGLTPPFYTFLFLFPSFSRAHGCGLLW